MNQILSMREKRANLWDAAKKYRDTHIGEDGTMGAEDAATYDRMVEDVDRMRTEIERLERQQAIDAELNQPTARPLAGKPMQPNAEEKTGRATDDYQNAFWKAMRNKAIHPEVYNSLQVGSDSEGGYLVPDEYERTLIEALLDKNIFRRLAHVIHTSSGERKIPIAVSKGTGAGDEDPAVPLVITPTNETFLNQPPCARNIVVAVAATTAGNIATGEVVVAGKDITGAPISEAFMVTADTAGTLTGTKAFAEITQITIPVQDGDTVTFDVGWGNKMGLPMKLAGGVHHIVTFLGASAEGTAPTFATSAEERSGNTIALSTALKGQAVETLFIAR